MPGSMAVAEERQMGTLQAQLIAPISRTKQWLIKVLVAVGLTYLLGLVIPFGVYYLIDGWINPFGEHVRFDDEQRVAMVLAVIYGAGSVVSLYASSFAATPLRAILSSFGIVVGGWVLGAVVLEFVILPESEWKIVLQDWTIQAYADPNSLLRGLNRIFEAFGIQGGLAMTYVGVALVTLLAIVLFAKLLALGYANFRRAGLAKSSLKLQLGLIASYVMLSVFCLGVLALVFDTGLIQWANQQNNQMRMNQRQRQVPPEFR
jgi:ABC-type transport system involved in multi-copper enzyme maturation permease subunit